MSAGKAIGVREFYRNKSILLTGCTGFLGTAITEKLLRSFPDIQKLYLVGRGSRSKNLCQRSEEYFNDEVFSRMKRENPTYLSKIEWIEGDLNKPNLGIKVEDADKIKNNVNVVLHNGASIRFNDPLKSTLQTNCMATLDLLDITKKMLNIECFMYVSTAYSNATKTTNFVEERLYPHPINPRKLLKLATNQAVLDVKIIEPWPSCYSYSKNVSENICVEYNDYFPVGVFRPAGILSSYEEPFKYWFKSLAGFGGLLQFVHKGTKRVFHTNPLSLANTVPVDMTANALITNAYDVATKKYCNVPFMNYTSNNNPCSWREALKYSLENTKENGKYGLTANPSCISIENKNLYNILIFLKQFIPAHYKDFILYLQQEKGQYVKLNDNLNALVGALNYIMVGYHRWDNNYAERLFNELSKEEQKLLNFNIQDLNWRTYYNNIIIESRKVYYKTALGR